ncbi:replication initiation and membrane attachment [Clostridium acetireducens DSM 10703]|uniref:Replication initiation and membrane attachment n=1 Tax=Clostridium acetireducens DSM 10703 TaxID=1121290 RepID=A0A1E8EZQ9_9CLOT|nr:DnaD domain protein [Clostridium acetireducens]OFI06626.1 replication initiation and membrane attachment [Clostridium acetireducens DSM 10703]
MSTFVFKNNSFRYTPVSNVFIDKYMPKARGEFVKVYLLGLKYCVSGEIGVNSSIMANTLHLLETDVLNAWNYWNDEGVIKMIPVDNMNNYKIDFINLNEYQENKEQEVDLLKELENKDVKDMLQDIEKLIARPLSSKEMSMYIGWLNDFNFTPEIILLLIQYCISKGKTDSRYIEKIALSWYDAKIKTVDDAQLFIKKREDKWMKIRKILNYLGIKDSQVMKPQEDMLTKWINTYKFSLEIIFKACDICFERINKADFKYIDGILTSWFKDNIKTLEDISIKDNKKGYYKRSNSLNKNKGTFNNYEQRNYNFNELEKKLLGWDK